ncbi:speriolin-like protein [Arapaima gigas]
MSRPGGAEAVEDADRSYELLSWQNTMLRRANADLRLLLDVAKENLSLRSRFLGRRDGAELSGNKSINATETLDEGKFTESLVRAPRRTSSPLTSSAKGAVDRSVAGQEEPTCLSQQSHGVRRLQASAQRPLHQNTLEHDDATAGPPDLSLRVKDVSCRYPERLLGEIAFQLDRRILAYVFQGQTRLYGFTTLNIPDKIIQVSKHPASGKVDEAYRCALTKRYLELMEDLQFLGYSLAHHPAVTELVINTYGVLKQRPDSQSAPDPRYGDPDFLRKVIIKTAPPKMFKDLLTLFSCLCFMVRKDGKPLFLW